MEAVIKIVVGYPSIPNLLGRPQSAQNRQYQEFNESTNIYPMVMASAATMLKNAGHEVFWMDGPAEKYLWEDYLLALCEINPAIILWEIKTPVVKKVWPLIDEVKELLPDCKVILCGDHITALPEESFKNCKVDYCLTGGDFDFGILNILKYEKLGLLEKSPLKNYCYSPSGDFEPLHGIFNQPTDTPLSALPVIDRKLTQWELYAYKNGNYKYLPATYTYFGRDCWYRKDGGCTFCSWTNTFKNFRVVSVGQAMSEVENCASLGIREIFDDTGTFPVGKWLNDFCNEMIKFNKGKKHGKAKITMGCNMRPGALKESDYRAMGAAGFRFILYGMESANFATTEKINKGQGEGDTEEAVKWATKHGMDPHLTLMVGYPFESKQDAEKTIEKARYLFKKGYAKTLQATICIPYPGTKLFRQCEENGWLKYGSDWDQYNMRRPVMICPMTDGEVLEMTRGIYKSCLTPSFMAKKIISIRTKDDVKFLYRAGKHLIGHLRDFNGKSN